MGTVLGQSYGVPYRTVGQDRQCIVVYGMGYVWHSPGTILWCPI